MIEVNRRQLLIGAAAAAVVVAIPELSLKPLEVAKVPVVPVSITDPLERRIAEAGMYFRQSVVGDVNDSVTRMHVNCLMKAFMDQQPEVYDFMVKCDEINNPPSVIDDNDFVLDVYWKIDRSWKSKQMRFANDPRIWSML